MENKKQIFLTSEGFLELEQELNYLKLEKREEIKNTLKEARALGDLSENSEYTEARAAQAENEKRISELEYELENAVIIEEGKKDKVGVGSVVELIYDGDESDREEYKIVGSREADPFNNKISNESPIGKAVIGHKKGEELEVSSPNGSYTILLKDVK